MIAPYSGIVLSEYKIRTCFICSLYFSGLEEDMSGGIDGGQAVCLNLLLD